ncbi:UNKNOWN [Stylonychia lemnae]|uniref:Transmembrane protein n=1 Tax=Stylonychia lemnae TaxID=5949 RepID=A0A077ZTQ7_STYLE|nr:UNKNOWN [Stylonychia lemnae]|eukprot:CDW72720.1 UNKNOWN [Stylonychia lemnae]
MNINRCILSSCISSNNQYTNEEISQIESNESLYLKVEESLDNIKILIPRGHQFGEQSQRLQKDSSIFSNEFEGGNATKPQSQFLMQISVFVIIIIALLILLGYYSQCKFSIYVDRFLVLINKKRQQNQVTPSKKSSKRSSRYASDCSGNTQTMSQIDHRSLSSEQIFYHKILRLKKNSQSATACATLETQSGDELDESLIIQQSGIYNFNPICLPRLVKIFQEDNIYPDLAMEYDKVSINLDEYQVGLPKPIRTSFKSTIMIFVNYLQGDLAREQGSRNLDKFPLINFIQMKVSIKQMIMI